MDLVLAWPNMSNPTHVCPNNWTLFSLSGIRVCGYGVPNGRGCLSTYYPTSGQTYSRVCGRVIAYQYGAPDAFEALIGGATIEDAYLDGISITHGSPGSRQHIWSSAIAIGEEGDFESDRLCGCSNGDNWPYSTSFVGNDYFCDTANHNNLPSNDQFLSQDPLWNGMGCGASSTCCQFNTPPWFCKTLPQPSTDDLEVRMCRNEGMNENIDINLVELYVQ